MGYPVDNFTLEERLEHASEELMNETENPSTYQDKQKMFLLMKMLDLVEYLKGIEEDPIPGMFE